MRPEDFTVSPDDPVGMGIYCPIDGCPWYQGVGDELGSEDLGSLLAAARDHLTTRHPTEGPDT